MGKPKNFKKNASKLSHAKDNEAQHKNSHQEDVERLSGELESELETSTDDIQNDDQDLPLLAHLIELRSRLMYIIFSVLVIFCGLFYFSGELYQLIANPILEQLPEGGTLIATDVTATFFAPFKLALVAAFFLAMPVVFYQLWKFIAPGLYQNEKRFLFPVLFLSVALFYAGVAFAHFVIFPIVMGFFTSIAPESVQVTPDISQYLNIALKLFFAFGIAFEIPVITMIVIWSNITSVEKLKKNRPYIVVFCFIFGMLLTPPDPLSQSMLAIPMWLLFELGLILGQLKFKEKETQGKDQS